MNGSVFYSISPNPNRPSSSPIRLYTLRNPTRTRNASARITGGPLAPNLRGIIRFQDVPGGTEVSVEIAGIPDGPERKGDKTRLPRTFISIETEKDQPPPVDEIRGSNRRRKLSPGSRIGEFPSLVSNRGYARISFFTDQFQMDEIIGGRVILHQEPDGGRKRLACGMIL
ncbi:superoxide dismutase family protein [Kroppenstedtia eburnea]|uniref:Superoxide dismutase, Cu-Zn family n=1 Tax=Kroppenstedtia eburnea TaxID=714067 RepID=A0A1N7NAE7_9BACL|nr:hypothetical protein [Kroppenstedtia eburnea]QKI83112.1 superoxide dismutase family protein [Kroppenstedtia eburnea]SIS95334.1 superoxide dismutase, Cu-Zn family [Kroppenstedtia eburnea]